MTIPIFAHLLCPFMFYPCVKICKFVFFFLMIRPPPGSPLFPYTTLFKPGASRHEFIDAVAAHLTDSEVPEFDFNFATVYRLDQRDDGATLGRMAAGAATAAAIELGSSPHSGKKVPRWALDEDRLLAEDDVLVHVARSWQSVIVGPMPAGEHADVISGGIPVAATWTEVPVVYSNGMVKGTVLACLIGEKAHAGDEAPFTLAGEGVDRGRPQ